MKEEMDVEHISYIHLTSTSTQKSITFEELKTWLTYYETLLTKTGQQLNWEYEQTGFPYKVMETESSLYLKGTLPQYYSILLDITVTDETAAIKIALPSKATHGDKGKANELAKFLAKKLKGQLQLFNGRIMSF